MLLDSLDSYYLTPRFQNNCMKMTEVRQPFGYDGTEDGLWTAQFKEFVEKEGKEALFYWIYQNHSHKHRKNEKTAKEVMNTFRRLKKNAPELYEDVMTPDFLSLLLFHMVCTIFSECPAQSKMDFISWLRGELREKPDQNDMWNAIQCIYGKEVFTENSSGWNIRLDMLNMTVGDRKVLAEYMSVWKECFSAEIEINMADSFQKETLLFIFNVSADRVIGQVIEVPDFINTISYFRNNVGTPDIEAIADFILHEIPDKEIMYYALKKNLITSDIAYRQAERILSEKNEKQEYMPMLIMKIHEEWEGGK